LVRAKKNTKHCQYLPACKTNTKVLYVVASDITGQKKIKKIYICDEYVINLFVRICEFTKGALKITLL
jgi:hypothetical protein